MKHWRIVEVTDTVKPTDLTSSELVGISVVLTQTCGEPYTDQNVYWRARQKIQPAVETALEE